MLVVHMVLVYIFIIFYGMACKKYFYLISLLTIILLLGNCRYKTYVIESPDKIKRIKNTEKFVKSNKYHKVLKSYTYQISNDICEISTIDSIIPYIDMIYNKTQMKEFYQYVNEKELVHEGDSIVHFKFRYPRNFHVQDSYIYSKARCRIYYTRIYTGKF